jgi:hypothetical protein
MFIQIYSYLHVMWIYCLWIPELNTLISMFESVWTFQIRYDIYYADLISIVVWMVLCLVLEISALYSE